MAPDIRGIWAGNVGNDHALLAGMGTTSLAPVLARERLSQCAYPEFLVLPSSMLEPVRGTLSTPFPYDIYP